MDAHLCILNQSKITKPSFMKKIILFGLIATTLFSSCKKDDDNIKSGIFKGPVMQVYQGKAWTWVQIDNSGKPERLAICITDAALNSVPVGESGEDGHDHSHEANWNLQFHPKAGVTPFNHVGMGWNPNGHEPEIFYGKPH